MAKHLIAAILLALIGTSCDDSLTAPSSKRQRGDRPVIDHAIPRHPPA
jgi:hypothetical protein